MSITISQFQQFEAVVRHMSFTKAADELFLHPSTVSKNIQRIEDDLQTTILLRKNSGLELTSTGSILYAYAKMIIAQYKQMEDAIEKAKTGMSGKIKFLWIETFMTTILDLFGEFTHTYPLVEWTILPQSYESLPNIASEIINREADIGMTLSFMLPKDCSELDIFPVYHEQLSILASRQHPLALRGTDLVLEDLSGETISISEHTPNKILDALNTELMQKQKPPIIVECCLQPRSTDSLLISVSHAKGLSIAPQKIATRSGDSMTSLEFRDRELLCDVVLICRKDNNNPVLLKFIECLKQHIQDGRIPQTTC